MNYKEQFSKRCESYFSAMSKYPNAMAQEFQVAVNALDLQGHETVVNIPAGCVNLDLFFPPTVHYKPFEIDEHFARRVHQEVCSLYKIPCETNSVDRVITVAGLHHFSEQERRQFYEEIKRILKPGGVFIIADVQQGSLQDVWLNDFVNTYNSLGHKGLFWSEADGHLLEETGFSVHMCEKSYAWTFTNRAAMVDFSKDLFYLDLATEEQIDRALTEVLQATETEIPWKLLYFICKI